MKEKKIFAITMALTTLLTSTHNTSCANKPGLMARAHRRFYTAPSKRNREEADAKPRANSDTKSNSSLSHHDMMEKEPRSSTPSTSTRTPDSKQDMEEEKTSRPYTFHLDGKATTTLPTTEDLYETQDMIDEEAHSDKPHTLAPTNTPSVDTVSRATTPTTSQPNQLDQLVGEIESLLSKPNSEELRKFLADNAVLVENSLDKETLRSKLQEQSINLEKLTLIVIKLQTNSETKLDTAQEPYPIDFPTSSSTPISPTAGEASQRPTKKQDWNYQQIL